MYMMRIRRYFLRPGRKNLEEHGSKNEVLGMTAVGDHFHEVRPIKANPCRGGQC